MKYDNQLRYAVNIIRAYDGLVPLSAWLKEFFKNNKQMGSRDRKTVSEMVYGFYRLGHNEFEKIEDRVIAAMYLLKTLPDILEYFKPAAPVVDKKKIFLPTAHLSGEISADKFVDSFLQQPDLFLRIRPGHKNAVTRKLTEASIPYTPAGDQGLAFSNATKLESILEINKEVVVQDLSSQRCGDFFHLIPFPVNSVWDCCAASGGKSIMAVDFLKKISLTVSDKRKSIIEHLTARFATANIKDYDALVIDLSKERPAFAAPRQFDLVIADVPCTGSGTWSRTPEQLYFFKEERITYYRNLQEKIITNAIPYIGSPGVLLYITCSVFKEENEQMVDFILSNSSLQLSKMELIKGYENRADTMFAALFTILPA